MSDLDAPVAAWAPLIRALMDRGVRLPVVVLVFDHYRIAGVGYGDAVASVAAALGMTPDEVGGQVSAVCTDPARVEAVVAELLEVHRVIDEIPGSRRGSGAIPTAAKTLSRWRSFARRRDWPVTGSLCSAPWLALLRRCAAAGFSSLELEKAVRMVRVRLRSGVTLEPLDATAARETLLEVPASEIGSGGLEETDVPARLRTLAEVEAADGGPIRLFGADRYVPAFGTTTLAPPWTRFPEPPQSLRWRMGGGEDVMDEWHLFWGSLDPEARAAYLRDHPPPPEWSDWTKHLAEARR